MQAISSQMILSNGTLDFNGATLIPIDVDGRVLAPKPHTVSIVELGKKLLKAANDGENDLVKELMGKGAPFTTDWLGTGPLHFAALNNHVETCEVLLRAGISRDARTKVDRTPLHVAAYEGHTAIVEILLMNGAEVDAKDMLRMTPLHWAIQNGHASIVNILLRNGANPEAVNKFQKTPVDIAIETQRMDLLEMLQFVTKDPVDATQNLAMELAAAEQQEESDDGTTEHATNEKLDAAQIECEAEVGVNEGAEEEYKPEVSSAQLPDPLEMLREHGISFLPNDTSSVVASAMENGHSLVLTDVGREVLDSTKGLVKVGGGAHRSNVTKLKASKVITVTTEQLLAMAGAHKNVFRRIPASAVVAASQKQPVKRIVMNKNKIVLSRAPNIVKRQTAPEPRQDVETIQRQLAEARKQADEYRLMLKRKEAEAEKYKRQLLSIAHASN